MHSLSTVNDETRRLSELKKYNIIDSSPEAKYQNIAHLASDICEAPVAHISFIEENRQWLKSTVGFNVSETERIHSFCTHTIQNPKEMMVIEDARKDSRFQNNPYVVGPPYFVFYAGMPLVNKQNYALGAVCVLDTKPRTLSKKQIKALQIFSVQLMHMLELRRINHEHETLALQVKDDIGKSDKINGISTDNLKLALRNVLADQQALPKDWGNEKNNSDLIGYLKSGNPMETEIEMLIEKIMSHYEVN